MPKAHKHPARRTKVPDAIPVAPLRDYFQRHLQTGEFTSADVATRAGWSSKRANGRGGPDTTRVLRLLGISPSTTHIKRGKHYGGYRQEYINYDHAVRICRAMGADPVDFDL